VSKLIVERLEGGNFKISGEAVLSAKHLWLLGMNILEFPAVDYLDAHGTRREMSSMTCDDEHPYWPTYGHEVPR